MKTIFVFDAFGMVEGCDGRLERSKDVMDADSNG